MTEAARIAAQVTNPTWIMAHVQTDGRGRRGNTWLTPTGNLTATLVSRPNITAQEASQRSFVAANALHHALANYVSPDQLALKWPNDVLLNGGKVAGILLESSAHRGEIDFLSVGIGVNLQTAPQVPDARFPPTSLKSAGAEVAAADFLTVLAAAYATQEALIQSEGFARIRSDWLQNAARLGQVITARTMTDTISGIFDTIDENGNLVLITGAGAQVVPAADVYF